MIDDASPIVSYDKTFRFQKLSKAVNSTLHTSTDTAAYVTLSFQGSRVEWFGELNAYSGIASVSVDGSFVQFVDAYSPSTLNQQRLFGAYTLSDGNHVLTISNTVQRNARSRGNSLSIDAFVVPQQTSQTSSLDSLLLLRAEPQVALSAKSWNLVQRGNSGVSAMQLSVVSDTQLILIDKVEHNLIDINGHPAWAALYDLGSHTTRPLSMASNSFCAGGTWLSNGTLLNIGGNPIVEAKTGAADFGDVNGLQAIRMFTPCDNGKCEIQEDASRIRLTSARWYSSSTRLDDGSVMIIGGSTKGGWMNNGTTVCAHFTYPLNSRRLLRDFRTIQPSNSSLPRTSIISTGYRFHSSSSLIRSMPTSSLSRLPSPMVEFLWPPTRARPSTTGKPTRSNGFPTSPMACASPTL